MARHPNRRAISAGGVVLDTAGGEPHVVLIAHRTLSGALRWTLPKGGLEEGENLQAAALREVLEETGYRCAVVRALGSIDYWFMWRPDGVRYHKYVHYFLMRPLCAEAGPHDDEAAAVERLPVRTALPRLSHRNERDLLAAAVQDAAGAPA